MVRHQRIMRVLIVPLLFAALCPLAACTREPVEFGRIEQASVVRHFVNEAPAHPDNLRRRQLGAVTAEGKILNMDLANTSRLRRDGLTGAAFTIDLWAQWGSGMLGNSFWDSLGHMSVLEFTFPESPFPEGAQVRWYVQPHLVCSYQVDQFRSSELRPSWEVPPEAELWIDYVVVEDSVGVYDLMTSPAEAMVSILEASMDVGQVFALEGGGQGTVVESGEVMEGTFTLLPETNPAKIYVGVSLLMLTGAKDDRVRVGGEVMPIDLSGTDRCTFAFGRDSYYTMRPLVKGG